MIQTRISDAPRLSLVSGECLAANATLARVPSLAAQPFRPGELPDTVPIELDEQTAGHAERRAAETGIPTELWIRLGVEAARAVNRIVETIGAEVQGVVLALDQAAETTRVMAPLATRRQRTYASHLREAGPRPRSNRRRFSLSLPDQMLAGWSIDAAVRATTLSEYISGLMLQVPSRIIEWEAAAADRGWPLAEWIYAEILQAFRPQQAMRSNSRTGGAEGSGGLPHSHPERRRASRR